MVYDQLNDGKPVRSIDFTAEQKKIVNQLPLITAKPIIFACNVDAESYLEDGGSKLANGFKEYVKETYPGLNVVTLCSTLEEDISQIRAEEGEEATLEYLEMTGLGESALDGLLENCAEILDLKKYYTAGPTEVASWHYRKGALAPEAAGKIHSKFQEKFICGEICKVSDFVEHKNEDVLRRKNIFKRMGKEYLMQENDCAVWHHAA